jgi:hypothetical protein
MEVNVQFHGRPALSPDKELWVNNSKEEGWASQQVLTIWKEKNEN